MRADAGLFNLDQLADRLMALLHSGMLPDDGRIYESMADFFTHHFDQALTLGWHAVDPKLRQYLNANVQRFSGFKTYAVQQAMREKLTDAEGNLRPFADFRADALAVHDQYNVRYLHTEYEQAIAGAQMASKWADFAPGSLLRYDTAGDDRVRHDHAIYDGIVRSKDDPFWDGHYPPCDWGCRCTAVEVDDDTPVTPANELRGLPQVPEEFRPNVGKTGEVFGPEHPYFDVPAKVLAKIEQQLHDAGLTAARRPAEDKNLYERFKIGKRAPFPAQQAAAKEALWAADDVHSLPPMPTERFKKVEFLFKKQAELGLTDARTHLDKVIISLSRDLPVGEVGLTTLHETGHFIDLMYFKPEYVMAHPGIAKAEVDAVVQAARHTRVWQQYQGRLNLDASDHMATYLSEPKEVWARAYAQYIAEKSGNESLLAAVKEQAAYGGDELPEHWTPEDFAPIRREIDRLFKNKGWLRE